MAASSAHAPHTSGIPHVEGLNIVADHWELPPHVAVEVGATGERQGEPLWSMERASEAAGETTSKSLYNLSVVDFSMATRVAKQECSEVDSEQGERTVTLYDLNQNAQEKVTVYLHWHCIKLLLLF